MHTSTLWSKTQWACLSSHPFYWRSHDPPRHARSQADCCCCLPDSDWTTWRRNSDPSLARETPDTRARTRSILLSTTEERLCDERFTCMLYFISLMSLLPCLVAKFFFSLTHAGVRWIKIKWAEALLKTKQIWLLSSALNWCIIIVVCASADQEIPHLNIKVLFKWTHGQRILWTLWNVLTFTKNKYWQGGGGEPNQPIRAEQMAPIWARG